MLIDKRLLELRNAYEIAYNEAVRLGYEVLAAIDKANELGNRDQFSHAAQRADIARKKWVEAGEQVRAYLRV